MPHVLTITISKEIRDYHPVFYNPLSGLFSQQKPYETLHSTQTRRDDLLFTSMIDALFTFLHSMAGSREMFFSGLFNMLCLRLNWYCANRHFFHSFRTNTRTCQDLCESKQYSFCPHACSSQHKIKVPHF